MNLLIKWPTVLIIAIALGLCGCRAPNPDDQSSDEDTDSNLPDAGTEPGCPKGYEDRFDNSSSPYLGGNKEVLIEVSVSSDFHCPYCLSFEGNMLELIKRQDYKDYVRIYFHHFPIHSDSWDIHYAAVAVQNQSIDGFWKLHDEIFQRESDLQRMSLKQLTDFVDSELDIDMKKYEKDRKSDETKTFVEDEMDQARKFELTGTPTVWVCGEKIRWGSLEKWVDYYLGDKKNPDINNPDAGDDAGFPTFFTGEQK